MMKSNRPKIFHYQPFQLVRHEGGTRNDGYAQPASLHMAPRSQIPHIHDTHPATWHVDLIVLGLACRDLMTWWTCNKQMQCIQSGMDILCHKAVKLHQQLYIHTRKPIIAQASSLERAVFPSIAPNISNSAGKSHGSYSRI